MKEGRFNRFSVPLGLLDYINPIFYTITITRIIRHIGPVLGNPYHIILIVGAVLSILFGFVIPTGKVIVGLGILAFRMPVILVFLVNLGILLSGTMFLKYTFGLNGLLLFLIGICVLILLFLIYRKNKKINTVAVMTGAFGYVMIYLSLITLSFRNKVFLPAVLSVMAIFLFVMLCSIGIKANLKDPKVHWKIEISNVICQGLVAMAATLLFR